jgi:hypothetical protein
LSIPGFLIPIIALEVVALLAVIWGLWLLLTNKIDADELDRAPRRRGRITATGQAREHAAVSSSANRAATTTPPDVDDLPSPIPAAAKSDSSEQTATTSSENVSDEIDPSWPPPESRTTEKSDS